MKHAAPSASPVHPRSFEGLDFEGTVALCRRIERGEAAAAPRVDVAERAKAMTALLELSSRVAAGDCQLAEQGDSLRLAALRLWRDGWSFPPQDALDHPLWARIIDLEDIGWAQALLGAGRPALARARGQAYGAARTRADPLWLALTNRSPSQKLLLALGSSLSEEDVAAMGRSPLCLDELFDKAARGRPVAPMILSWIDQGMPVDAEDSEGRSFLAYLSGAAESGEEAPRAAQDAIEELLSRGANPDKTDARGDAPLWLVCQDIARGRQGHAGIALALIKGGADAFAPGSDGLSAWSLARAHGWRPITEALAPMSKIRDEASQARDDAREMLASVQSTEASFGRFARELLSRGARVAMPDGSTLDLDQAMELMRSSERDAKLAPRPRL